MDTTALTDMIDRVKQNYRDKAEAAAVEQSQKRKKIVTSLQVEEASKGKNTIPLTFIS